MSVNIFALGELYMFTIYYLNFNKTYEIKTMLSDTIKIGSTIESFEGKETNSNLQAKLGVSFLELFNVDVGSSITTDGNTF